MKDGDKFCLVKVVPVQEVKKEKEAQEEPVKEEQKQFEKPLKIKINFKAEPQKAKE